MNQFDNLVSEVGLFKTHSIKEIERWVSRQKEKLRKRLLTQTNLKTIASEFSDKDSLKLLLNVLGEIGFLDEKRDLVLNDLCSGPGLIALYLIKIRELLGKKTYIRCYDNSDLSLERYYVLCEIFPELRNNSEFLQENITEVDHLLPANYNFSRHPRGLVNEVIEICSRPVLGIDSVTSVILPCSFYYPNGSFENRSEIDRARIEKLNKEYVDIKFNLYPMKGRGFSCIVMKNLYSGIYIEEPTNEATC